MILTVGLAKGKDGARAPRNGETGAGPVRRVTRARNVGAPPAAVWKVLSDFGGIARWAPNVDHSCLVSEQADGVGAVRRVQAGRTVVVEHVGTWQPELMLSYTIEGLPEIVGTPSNTWIIRPDGDGTSVSVLTDIDASRPVGRIVAVWLGHRMGRASTAMLAGLANHLEERP